MPEFLAILAWKSADYRFPLDNTKAFPTETLTHPRRKLRQPSVNPKLRLKSERYVER